MIQEYRKISILEFQEPRLTRAMSPDTGTYVSICDLLFSHFLVPAELTWVVSMDTGTRVSVCDLPPKVHDSADLTQAMSCDTGTRVSPLLWLFSLSFFLLFYLFYISFEHKQQMMYG